MLLTTIVALLMRPDFLVADSPRVALSFTSTLMAFVITPFASISSSGLWPEKMWTSAFHCTVRVWLLLVSPCDPPLASARLL